VRIEQEWYGDGGIRLTSPLSPALHLGAERVIAIGIRYQRPDDQTRAMNEAAPAMTDISVADVAGVVLNGTFLDSLEADAERMQRINQTIGLMTDEQASLHPHQLRVVPLLMLRPSQDLGRLAAEEFHRFPAMLRYMLRGLGASDEKGWDLLSYLSFDRGYTVPLLELGRADTVAQRDAILEFFGLPPTVPPILPPPEA
jgi:NTE family protein